MGISKPSHVSFVIYRMNGQETDAFGVKHAVPGQLYKFINDCLLPIIDYTFSVRDPDPNPIATVAELDKKLDNFQPVEMFRWPHDPPNSLSFKVTTRLILCAKHYGESLLLPAV